MAKKPKADDTGAPNNIDETPPSADATPVPPTVGRIVHFVAPDRPPLAALVVGAAGDDEKVTLSVFTPQGGRFTKTCGAAMNNGGTGWAWPPKV